jgi:hypothetical protein
MLIHSLAFNGISCDYLFFYKVLNKTESICPNIIEILEFDDLLVQNITAKLTCYNIGRLLDAIC